MAHTKIGVSIFFFISNFLHSAPEHSHLELVLLPQVGIKEYLTDSRQRNTGLVTLKYVNMKNNLFPARSWVNKVGSWQLSFRLMRLTGALTSRHVTSRCVTLLLSRSFALFPSLSSLVDGRRVTV